MWFVRICWLFVIEMGFWLVLPVEVGMDSVESH